MKLNNELLILYIYNIYKTKKYYIYIFNNSVYSVQTELYVGKTEPNQFYFGINRKTKITEIFKKI